MTDAHLRAPRAPARTQGGQYTSIMHGSKHAQHVATMHALETHCWPDGEFSTQHTIITTATSMQLCSISGKGVVSAVDDQCWAPMHAPFSMCTMHDLLH